MSDDSRAAMKQEVLAYIKAFPEDTAPLRRLLKQLEAGEDVFDRRNFTGHVCGSGIVLSPDRTQVLLIHHKRFDRWQQPGGHVDQGEATPLDAARRETLEEAGVRLGQAYLVNGEPIPLHIGVHRVPANPAKDEPEHWHYDFRYLFIADTMAVQHQELEVHAAEWFSLDDARTTHIAPVTARLRTLSLVETGLRTSYNVDKHYR